MATSFIKKSMAYLGLVDDYDDYDDYDSRPAPVAPRQRPVAVEAEERGPPAPTGRIRVTAANRADSGGQRAHSRARTTGDVALGQDLHA